MWPVAQHVPMSDDCLVFGPVFRRDHKGAFQVHDGMLDKAAIADFGWVG